MDDMKIFDTVIEAETTGLLMNGTLILGQEQDLLSGGFDVSDVFLGRVAQLHIWDADTLKLYNVHVEQVILRSLCQAQQKVTLFKGIRTVKKLIEICRTVGGALHVPSSQLQTDLLFNTTTTSNYICGFVTNVWLGISDEEEEGVWRKFSDSSLVSSTFFARNEPDGDRPKNCVVLAWDEPKWHDMDCGKEGPACAPCTTDYTRPLWLKGLCFESEEESFMEILGYKNKAAFFHGYYGFSIYKLTGSDGWHLFSFSLNKTVATTYLTSETSYPIRRHSWTLTSNVCHFLENKEVFLGLSLCFKEEFICYNAFCIPRNMLCDGFTDCEDLSDEVACQILKIPICYQKIRPPEPEVCATGAVTVGASLEIVKFVTVDDAKDLIELIFDVQMTWKDLRLGYFNLKENLESNRLNSSEIGQLWIPTLDFPSVYNGNITLINQQLHVHRSGTELKTSFNAIRADAVYTGRSGVLVFGQRVRLDNQTLPRYSCL